MLLTLGKDRKLAEQGLIDVSYFVSDMTGPGSVLRAGESAGLTYEGNVLDCIAFNAGKLRDQVGNKMVIDALSIKQEVVDIPSGRLRMTPGEFLRFERQVGVPEQFRRIGDVEMIFEDAKLYKEEIDSDMLREALALLVPYLSARCQGYVRDLGYLVVSSWRVEGLTYRPVRSRVYKPKVTEESISDFFLFPPEARYQVQEEKGTVRMLDKRSLFVGEYIKLEAPDRIPIPLEEAVRLYKSLYFK